MQGTSKLIEKDAQIYQYQQIGRTVCTGCCGYMKWTIQKIIRIIIGQFLSLDWRRDLTGHVQSGDLRMTSQEH